MIQIKFHQPYFSGNELKYITEIFKRKLPISGDGYYTVKATQLLKKKLFANKVLLTTSCTSALEMAVRLLKLQAGDEVIIPSFTFTSTANAVLLNSGINIRFADIQADTLNIDPEQILAKINKKTKAIIVMHYAGVSCDMEKISGIAKKHSLKVIEDAAHAVGAKYKNLFLGTVGDIGCLSFHESKNITSGEGGALIINNNVKNLGEEAEIIREKGTNRTKFIRGEIDKYSWVDVGSSYLPSDILSAVLYAQLQLLEKLQEKRLKIYNFYKNSLIQLEKKGEVKLPTVPGYSRHNAHTFYLLFNQEKRRNSALSYLKKNRIDARFHYISLHQSPQGRKLGYRPDDLPVSKKISETILRLPLYPGMEKREYEYVAEAVVKMFKYI